MTYKPNHPSEESFLRDVAQHQMAVLRDDGLDRHLRFMSPNTSNQYFDLITWRGSLCFTGDMGTFVFSRIADMFEFFRDDHPNGHLRINMGYWSEKLDAADRRTGGYEKFEPALFRKRVMEYAKDCDADRDTLRAIRDRVLPHADDAEAMAYAAACGFERDGFRLQDFWEINCRDYTYHFVWCCYALAWGIQKYDAQKAAEAQAA